MSRFSVTSHVIPERLLREDDTAGALATFVGTVRNHNEGRPVTALTYEAYPELAEKEGERIVAEAMGRFPILEAACVHRVGELQIGDVAIRVETTGAHRAEAFRACEWIVEEVKRRVPIWKKEAYVDGESGWVNATTPGQAVVTAADYYARQRSLHEFDGCRLAQARVLVVGAGGLGCPALMYLAGTGVGKLTIVDPDRVEVSNLHRQVLFCIDDLGMPKAVAAARRLRSLNPLIQIEAIEDRLSAENARELVQKHDLVLDGTDRLETKFLLNRICVGLNRPLVVASVHRFEGQLQTVHPDGPCLQCLWPDPPEDGCVGTCAETGVLGVTPGLLGTLQATEAIKCLSNIQPTEGVLLVDLVSMSMRTMKLSRRPNCPVCGEGARPLDDIVSIELGHVDEENYTIVDIREVDEFRAKPTPFRNVPMSAWQTPEPDRPLLLVCATGRRSLTLAKRLRAEGIEAFSFAGGVSRL